MSRIDEMIRELCPEGVLARPIDEVADVRRGSTISKKETTEGDVPVLAGGQKPAYWHSDANRTGENVVVAGSGAYAGFVTYWNRPIWASDSFTVCGKPELLMTKYCFYWLKNIQSHLHALKRGSGVPHVYARDVVKLRIPTPPLEVQREVVSILDKFTQLEAELEAELEARQKLYESVRGAIFRSHMDMAPALRLGDSTSVEMCKRIYKSQTSVSGDVPFFKIGTFGRDPDAFITREMFEDYKSKYPYPVAGEILISCSGTLGKVIEFDGRDAYFQDSNLVWLSNDERVFLNRYILHWMKAKTWSISGGTISRLYAKDIINLVLPCPPIDRQRETVSILDKLDALVNDITYGLPAEIEARRKQYEYYRNNLLTFKELDAA